MEQDILRAVVEVEKDIKNRLEIERNKSEEWLEKVKQEIETEILNEESGLKSEAVRNLDVALSTAGKEASSIIEEAKKNARKLDTLSDDFLISVLFRHIKQILPGG